MNDQSLNARDIKDVNNIFISYAREDLERAHALAQALETQGWSVLWDRTIPAGKNWDEYIEANIKQASCIVVVWSSTSVQSDWVKEEIVVARQHKIPILPVSFEQVQPPFGFRRIQAENLSNWNKSNMSPAFQNLVSAINQILEPTLINSGEKLTFKPAYAESNSQTTEKQTKFQKSKPLVRKSPNKYLHESVTKPSFNIDFNVVFTDPKLILIRIIIVLTIGGAIGGTIVFWFLG